MTRCTNPSRTVCGNYLGVSNMSSQTTVQSSGAGVLGLLGVVFVTLKLTGFIDWSWWWVTLPFWGGFALILAILAVVFVVALILENRR